MKNEVLILAAVLIVGYFIYNRNAERQASGNISGNASSSGISEAEFKRKYFGIDGWVNPLSLARSKKK